MSDLWTTDVGLMSLGVIVFILGMAVYFVGYFSKKMDEDARNSAK
jgi:hypothetical protein